MLRKDWAPRTRRPGSPLNSETPDRGLCGPRPAAEESRPKGHDIAHYRGFSELPRELVLWEAPQEGPDLDLHHRLRDVPELRCVLPLQLG